MKKLKTAIKNVMLSLVKISEILETCVVAFNENICNYNLSIDIWHGSACN